jgi:hypothetical protein
MNPYVVDHARRIVRRKVWDEMTVSERAETLAAEIAIHTDIQRPFGIEETAHLHGQLVDLLEGVGMELLHRYPRHTELRNMSRAALADIAYPALMEWAAKPSRTGARHIELLTYWWCMASQREAFPSYSKKAA